MSIKTKKVVKKYTILTKVIYNEKGYDKERHKERLPINVLRGALYGVSLLDRINNQCYFFFSSSHLSK